MPNKPNGLKKEERLYLREDLRPLFATPSGSFTAYPYRVVYRLLPSDTATRGYTPVSILISVGKKKFRHAVDRNRVKRLTREAYRCHKQTLLAEATQRSLSIHIALIMLDKELPTLGVVEKSIKKMTSRIIQVITSHAYE